MTYMDDNSNESVSAEKPTDSRARIRRTSCIWIQPIRARTSQNSSWWMISCVPRILQGPIPTNGQICPALWQAEGRLMADVVGPYYTRLNVDAPRCELCNRADGISVH